MTGSGGPRGKRRRYFLAAVLQRERDGRLKRWRIHHLRLPESAATRSRFGQLSRIPLNVASEHSTGVPSGPAPIFFRTFRLCTRKTPTRSSSLLQIPGVF